MRGLVLVLLLLAAGFASADQAQKSDAEDCDQRAQAKQLRGEARNDYIVECLRKGGNANETNLTLQQQRSKACNEAVRARRMQGAERRGFLAGCTKPPVDKRPPDCAARAKEMKVEGEDRLRFINGCVEGTKTAT